MEELHLNLVNAVVQKNYILLQELQMMVASIVVAVVEGTASTEQEIVLMQ